MPASGFHAAAQPLDKNTGGGPRSGFGPENGPGGGFHARTFRGFPWRFRPKSVDSLYAALKGEIRMPGALHRPICVTLRENPALRRLDAATSRIFSHFCAFSARRQKRLATVSPTTACPRSERSREPETAQASSLCCRGKKLQLRGSNRGWCFSPDGKLVIVGQEWLVFLRRRQDAARVKSGAPFSAESGPSSSFFTSGCPASSIAVGPTANPCARLPPPPPPPPAAAVNARHEDLPRRLAFPLCWMIKLGP